MTLIIAYKDGKWFVNIGGRLYSKPENYGVGMDVTSRIFQLAGGLIYWRWFPEKTHLIDYKALLWGKYAMVFEPVGKVAQYRFNGLVFDLQPAWKWDYRPRRGKHNRSPKTWFIVQAIDDQPVPVTPHAHQQTDNPLDAMRGYLVACAHMRGREGVVQTEHTYLI